MRGETRKASEKTQVYPLRYIEDFVAKPEEVAARIALTVAENTFETRSNYTQRRDHATDGRLFITRLGAYCNALYV